jgi:hypothetical protein
MRADTGPEQEGVVSTLEFLRKSAKTLLRACRAGDAASIARLRSALSHLAGLDDVAIAATVKLADVQHALARERGYASWAELKRHDEPVERFLVTIRGGLTNTAKRLLSEAARLAHESVHVACAIGDVSLLERHLAHDARLATAEHAGWPPIVYACASPLHRVSARHSSGIVECVKALLDRGVDPNTYTLTDAANPESQVPLTHRAVMTMNVAVMVLLHSRGAKPPGKHGAPPLLFGGERWHQEAGTYFKNPRFFQEVKRLSEESMKQHGVAPFHPQIPTDLRVFHRPRPASFDVALNELWQDLAGEGFDTNRIALKGPLLHAVARAGTPGLAEVLLEDGADPDEEWSRGHNAFVVAVREGNKGVADVLRAHGASASGLRLVDRLLGACRRLDEAEAQSIARAHPDIATRMLPEDTEVIVQAAARNSVEQVRLMGRSGLDLGRAGESGMTPLHAAAWHGHLDMVRQLLEFGMAVNVRDATYGTSPLGWAADGSTRCRDADDDYCGVVRALIDAGADRASAAGRSAEWPPLSASERVASLLRVLGST